MSMNIFDRQPAGHGRRRETFEEHLERMKAFRIAHDLTAPEKNRGITANRNAGTSLSTGELQKILPTLVKIGYLLNLIRERSTVLLPQNWQN